MAELSAERSACRRRFGAPKQGAHAFQDCLREPPHGMPTVLRSHVPRGTYRMAPFGLAVQVGGSGTEVLGSECYSADVHAVWSVVDVRGRHGRCRQLGSTTGTAALAVSRKRGDVAGPCVDRCPPNRPGHR